MQINQFRIQEYYLRTLALMPRFSKAWSVTRVISRVWTPNTIWTPNTRLGMSRTCSPTVDRLGLRDALVLMLPKDDGYFNPLKMLKFRRAI